MHMWVLPWDIGSGWWLFGGFWMLLFWGGLIALIVWAIIRLTGRPSPRAKDDLLEPARERYARGEITRGEFEQIKKDLS